MNSTDVVEAAVSAVVLRSFRAVVFNRGYAYPQGYATTS
jgi:hypothetical protein